MKKGIEANGMKLTGILLPTENASKLCITENKILDFTEKFVGNSGIGYTPQHLHLCSTREIKEGEYFINETLKGDTIFKCDGGEGLEKYYIDNYVTGTPVCGITRMSIDKTKCKRIEFTSDPKLIADGVPALPKKCTVHFITANKKNDIVETDFLSEFVNRYNQKQSTNAKGVSLETLLSPSLTEYRKGVDVEKLGDEYLKMFGKTSHATGRHGGFIDGFTKCQALQSNAGGFTLEDVTKILMKFQQWMVENNKPPYLNYEITAKEFLQSSLSPISSKQSSEIEMWCEMEGLSYGEGNKTIIENRKIKLDPSGQPLLHFK